MTILFSELSPNDEARITGFAPGNHAYRNRLMSLGLMPGTQFRVVRKAPLADPFEIYVRGFHLCLRKNEANILLLEKL